jgi:hypothetical protein
MSDFVHIKAIRLPLDKIIETKELNSSEVDKYLEDKLGDLFGYHDVKKFERSCTYSNYYLDWVYYYTYGEESGDWGHTSYLTDKEFEKIKPLFEKVVPDVKIEGLRKVDYCYYNCSEPPDYFEVEEDDSEELV